MHDIYAGKRGNGEGALKGAFVTTRISFVCIFAPFRQILT